MPPHRPHSIEPEIDPTASRRPPARVPPEDRRGEGRTAEMPPPLWVMPGATAFLYSMNPALAQSVLSSMQKSHGNQESQQLIQKSRESEMQDSSAKTAESLPSQGTEKRYKIPPASSFDHNKRGNPGKPTSKVLASSHGASEKDARTDADVQELNKSGNLDNYKTVKFSNKDRIDADGTVSETADGADRTRKEKPTGEYFNKYTAALPAVHGDTRTKYGSSHDNGNGTVGNERKTPPRNHGIYSETLGRPEPGPAAVPRSDETPSLVWVIPRTTKTFYSMELPIAASLQGSIPNNQGSHEAPRTVQDSQDLSNLDSSAPIKNTVFIDTQNTKTNIDRSKGYKRTETKTQETSAKVGKAELKSTTENERSMYASPESLEFSSKTTTEGTSKGPDSTATQKTSKEQVLDPTKGVYTITRSTESRTKPKNAEDGGSQSASDTAKDSTTFGPSGLAKSKETSYSVGDYVSKTKTDSSAQRGDGKIDFSQSKEHLNGKRGNDENIEQGSAVKTSRVLSALSKDSEFGIGASSAGSLKKHFGKHLSGALTGGFGIMGSISVTETTEQPKKYDIVLTIKLSFDAGANAEPAAGKLSVKFGVGANLGMVIKFRHRLHYAEALEYKQQLDLALNGSPTRLKYQEFGILGIASKLGLNEARKQIGNLRTLFGSVDAVKNMEGGAGIEFYLENKESFNAGISGNIANIGGSFDYENRKTGNEKYSIAKDDDKITVGVTFGSGSGTKAGFGVSKDFVSISASKDDQRTSEQKISFKLSMKAADFADKYREIVHNTDTLDRAIALGKKYPELLESQNLSENVNTSKPVSVSVIGMGVNATFINDHKYEVSALTDEKGARTTYQAENSSGMKYGTGKIEYLDSRKNSIQTEVNDRNIASAIIEHKKSSTNIRASILQMVDSYGTKTIAFLLGGTQNSDITNVSDGLMLSDVGIDMMIKRANTPTLWMNYVNLAEEKNVDIVAWKGLRDSIVKSNGDRRKIADALAHFVDNGGEFRTEVLTRMFDDIGHGHHYERTSDKISSSTIKEVVQRDYSEKIRALMQNNRFAEAREIAYGELERMETLHTSIRSNRDNANSPAHFAETLHDVSSAVNEVSELISQIDEVLSAQKKSSDHQTGVRISNDEVVKFKQRLSDCQVYQEIETASFKKIMEIRDSWFSRRPAAEVSQILTGLDKMYRIWNKDYDELSNIGAAHGFDVNVYGRYRPNKDQWQRLFDAP